MADYPVIETKDLRKDFLSKTKGKKKVVEAVKGVDLAIEKGQIFGFLGPNGAGKSTTQKMLSTLLLPTGGDARINGYDLAVEQQQIRQTIGYVSQAGGTDSLSTGMENLVLQARLYGLDWASARTRATELIDLFQMDSFAGRRADGYSGGQRRRLDLALGMIHRPQLLLLDEPTTGLDPQTRAHLWEEIKRLREDGVTIFLTTHYLDEADKLCDVVAIINDGKIVAEGTPAQLKSDIGADCLTLGFATGQIARRSGDLLAGEFLSGRVQTNEAAVRLYIRDGERLLPDLLRLLDANGLDVQTITLAKPSLDDVFLKYTGRSLREDS